MKLAVIPARGGSKRIPRKNIKIFDGRPVIAWSIQAAIRSQIFDRIIVSTDDREIAEVAKDYGADAPFIRPAELSDEYTATMPVVAHAIEWQKTNGEMPTEVCCIYATAPFMRSCDLQKGLDALSNSKADYAFSVTSYPFPIQRAIRITASQRVEMFQPECMNVRSQDLLQAFHDAGQFYWGRAQSWLSHQPILGANSVAIELPRYLVHDLDTTQDWEEAEILHEYVKHLTGAS